MPAHPLSLIIAGDPKPTQNALYEACTDARATGGSVGVVQLVPVGNPVLLGDPHAYWSLTSDQQRRLDEYVETAREYGIAINIHAMQIVNARSAMIDLIELFHPQVAYVPLPQSGPAWWREWRNARLSAAFAARGCSLVWVGTDYSERTVRTPLHQAEPQRAV